MKRKNTSSINNRRKDYKNFRCPEDYKKCEFYDPSQPEESRCVKDSNIGCCVKEYFDFCEKEEIITENGDIR